MLLTNPLSSLNINQTTDYYKKQQELYLIRFKHFLEGYINNGRSSDSYVTLPEECFNGEPTLEQISLQSGFIQDCTKGCMFESVWIILTYSARYFENVFKLDQTCLGYNFDNEQLQQDINLLQYPAEIKVTLTDDEFKITVNGANLTKMFGLLHIADMNADEAFETAGNVVKDMIQTLKSEGSGKTKSKDDIVLWQTVGATLQGIARIVGSEDSYNNVNVQEGRGQDLVTHFNNLVSEIDKSDGKVTEGLWSQLMKISEYFKNQIDELVDMKLLDAAQRDILKQYGECFVENGEYESKQGKISGFYSQFYKGHTQYGGNYRAIGYLYGTALQNVCDKVLIGDYKIGGRRDSKKEKNQDKKEEKEVVENTQNADNSKQKMEEEL